MPYKIHFSDEARSDLRAIDQPSALQILRKLDRFVETGSGDVKQLHGFDPPQYRLRIGDWRITFRRRGDVIEVIRVRDRKDAYR